MKSPLHNFREIDSFRFRKVLIKEVERLLKEVGILQNLENEGWGQGVNNV